MTTDLNQVNICILVNLIEDFDVLVFWQGNHRCSVIIDIEYIWDRVSLVDIVPNKSTKITWSSLNCKARDQVNHNLDQFEFS